MPFRPLRASVNDGNFGDVLSGALTTTNNTATAIVTYAPPANSTVYITATIVGRRTDGGNAGDGATATLTCCYKNIAGTLTQIGSDTAALPYASASINASAASSGTSGSTIQIKIAGVANATVNWIVQSAFAIVAQ